MTDRRVTRTDQTPPWRAQEDALGCGLAAARMVLAAHGVERSERELRGSLRLDALGAQGLTPWKVAALLRREGLDARVRHDATTADVERTLRHGGQAVVPLRTGDLYGRRAGLANHFVVVTGVEGPTRGDPADAWVHYHDPAAGPDQLMTRRHFERAWSRWGASGLGGLVRRPLVEAGCLADRTPPSDPDGHPDRTRRQPGG